MRLALPAACGQYPATPGKPILPVRLRRLLMTLPVTVLLPWQALLAQPVEDADRIVELRLYTLRAGTQERFHSLFVNQALPLLVEHQIDVVAYGPSALGDDTYFLMRSFASLDEREQSEAAFYGSRAWVIGPREAVLACIVHYTTVVRRVPQDTIAQLRALSQSE